MRRTLAPLALLLGAALAVVPAAADADGHLVATDRSLRSLHDQREAKKVVRAYGDGPVRQSATDQPIVIRFQGRRGDTVTLTRGNRGTDVLVLPGRLEGPHGGTIPRKGRPWWKLRSDGWHTVRFDSYVAAQPIAVQLTKLRFTDVERDGRKRTLPVRRGFVWAAGFAVPRKGLTSGVVLGDGIQQLVRPDKQRAIYLGRTTFVLGDGLPVAIGELYRFPGSRAQRAGAVVRVLTAGGVASAVTPERVTGALDGPAVTADPTVAQAIEVVVDGTDGQWVSTSGPDLGRLGLRTLVIGPDGTFVDPASYPDAWQLDGTGQSRLLLFPHQHVPATSMTLSSVVVGPTLVPNAPATRVTSDPTRGTILPVERTLSYKTIAATNPTFTGDWWGYLMLAHVPHYDPHCLGCGESDLVYVNQESPTSRPGGGSWLYLPPGNGTGSVDVQVLATGS